MRQHGVGEVVVLVDQHVQRDVVIARVAEQLGKLVGDGRRREDVTQRRFGKQVGMAPQSAPELDGAIGLELALQRFESVVDRREVEPQHDVAALFPGRVAPDVGSGEGRLEPAAPEAVVVVLQQRHPQRLAEPPRADEEDVALLLQPAQEAGLVDVQPPVAADALEVRLAVGNARVGRQRVHRSDRHVPTLSRRARRRQSRLPAGGRGMSPATARSRRSPDSRGGRPRRPCRRGQGKRKYIPASAEPWYGQRDPLHTVDRSIG